MEVDYTAWVRTEWERNCQFSAAIIVAFEFILHFPREVELFWKRPLTVAKGLFLWSRYYSLGYNIGNASVFMRRDATLEVRELADITMPHIVTIYNSSISITFRCNHFFMWQNTGSIIQQFTTHAILAMRIYGMYERSRKILLFLIGLIMAEMAGIIVFLVVPNEGVIGTNEPSPGIFICADADPPDSHWIMWVPVIILVTETIFLGLAVYRTAYTQYGGHLLRRLAKHSVYFYLALVSLPHLLLISLALTSAHSVMGIHIATIIAWMHNTVRRPSGFFLRLVNLYRAAQITLNELLSGYSFAIPSCLANRLLLDVREQLEPREEFTFRDTVRFDPRAFNNSEDQ
ncbi:hypothetical protein C8R44DRAFT_885929 [Mycena epipterygia]|nr:hypothetical protein C8R44DRAFT_885929 [Mycena epipterygia]